MKKLKRKWTDPANKKWKFHQLKWVKSPGGLGCYPFESGDAVVFL